MLHSGKNHIIQPIFEYLRYQVIALNQIKYTGLIIKTFSCGK